MARLIPNILPQVESRGEGKLFAMLRDDTDCKDWIVFHSLDVRRHRSKQEGELDFVVLIPKKGVVCIEVKSAEVIRRRQGMWQYLNSRDELIYEKAESPFAQCSGSMYSLKAGLERKEPSLKNIAWGKLVVFTESPFHESSPEWHTWEYINSDMLAVPISKLILHYFGKLHDELSGASWFKPELKSPTSEQCELLVKLLRGDFEVAHSPRQKITRAENAFVQFTEDQYQALDEMQKNPRIIFEGAAGTGKTFLAVESARRAVLSGRKTVLLCYNRLLGKWLQERTDAIPELAEARRQHRFRCGTMHSFMLDISQLKPDGTQEFWNQTLPQKTADALLTDSSHAGSWDMLIVDEMQDLTASTYTDIFSLILNGGLQNGHWQWFGDFERQAIYNTAAAQEIENLRNTYRSASRSLVTNCRNSFGVADELQMMTQTEYTKVLFKDNILPTVGFYSSEQHQSELLISSLKSLYAEGYKDADITILSPKNADACASKNPALSSRLISAEETQSTKIKVATVHAFKGMESPVIILTDIEDLISLYAVSLLYVGMSRARLHLHVLISDALKDTYISLVRTRKPNR